MGLGVDWCENFGNFQSWMLVRLDKDALLSRCGGSLRVVDRAGSGKLKSQIGVQAMLRLGCHTYQFA